MCIEYHTEVNLYHVSAQGVDERMLNAHDHYYPYEQREARTHGHSAVTHAVEEVDEGLQGDVVGRKGRQKVVLGADLQHDEGGRRQEGHGDAVGRLRLPHPQELELAADAAEVAVCFACRVVIDARLLIASK